MANIVNQTITVTGPATAQLLDWRASQFQVGIAYVVPAGTTATATVEHTYDADPSSASAVWFPSTVIAAATVSKEEYIQTPCAAVRLNVASISGGPVFLKIVKAG